MGFSKVNTRNLRTEINCNYSKLVNAKKRKFDEIKTQYEASSKRLKLIENVEDLSEIIQEIGKLEQLKAKLEVQIKSNQEKNPQDLKLMQSETQPVKEAANRWTDNIFAVKSWCKKKFMMEDKVLNKQFGIPEDLDYLA